MKQILTKWIYSLLFLISYPVFASSGMKLVGDWCELLLPVSAIGATVFHDDFTGLKELGYSYFLSTGSVGAIKYTIKRRRPGGSDDIHSFPSGHTANGFVSATFLQKRYGWLYGAPAYAFATFTGYSRVKSKRHWITDVIAGAAIGSASAYLFTNKYVKKVTVTPYYSMENKETGISIRWDQA